MHTCCVGRKPGNQGAQQISGVFVQGFSGFRFHCPKDLFFIRTNRFDQHRGLSHFSNLVVKFCPRRYHRLVPAYKPGAIESLQPVEQRK